MKNTVLTITLALSLAASSLSLAEAQAHENSHRGEHRLFSELNLSQTQKQDIGEILRQTQQDNSVFKGEKEGIREQMRLLMDMQEWDQAKALDIVSQRVEQATNLELNMARAKHQAFNVLNETQKAEFLNKRSESRDGKNKRKNLNIRALERPLSLSSEQVTAIEKIQDSHREQTESLKTALKNTKKAEKALVFAPEFNQQAWLTLQQEAVATRIEFGVAKTYAHYQMLNVLDDQQRARFASILDRMRKNMGIGFKRGKDKARSANKA